MDDPGRREGAAVLVLGVVVTGVTVYVEDASSLAVGDEGVLLDWVWEVMVEVASMVVVEVLTG